LIAVDHWIGAARFLVVQPCKPCSCSGVRDPCLRCTSRVAVHGTGLEHSRVASPARVPSACPINTDLTLTKKLVIKQLYLVGQKMFSCASCRASVTTFFGGPSKTTNKVQLERGFRTTHTPTSRTPIFQTELSKPCPPAYITPVFPNPFVAMPHTTKLSGDARYDPSITPEERTVRL